MSHRISYELHHVQLNQMKKLAGKITPITVKVSSKIHLNGLEIIPKNPRDKMPIAIILHGYTSNYRRLAYIANLFITNGIAVFLMNLRGHGKSTGSKTDVAGMQQDLDTIIQYITSKEYCNTKKILMVGVSLGALISLTAGFKHPAISHIIALAGFSSPTHLLDGMTLFRRFRWKIIGKIGGLNVSGMIGMPKYSPYIQLSQNPSIQKKILLIHCKNDRLVAVNNFKKNIEGFKLKKRDFHLIGRGGHGFFLVKNEVIHTIQHWLSDNI